MFGALQFRLEVASLRVLGVVFDGEGSEVSVRVGIFGESDDPERMSLARGSGRMVMLDNNPDKGVHTSLY